MNLLLCDPGRPGRLQIFYKQEARDTGAFVLAGREAAGLCPVSIKEERMKILQEKKKFLPKLSKPEWADWHSGGNGVETC